MEVIIGDFGLEWKYKDGVVHKADYDDLIKMYEKQEEHDKEIRSKAISNFADWCYINGIDFSYMSTAKKSGRRFIDDMIARYCKEVDTSDYNKAIRNKAIEEFAEKLNEKCNSMIAEKWNSEVAPISWANAYADFKDDVDEIAEQMKEVGE